MNELKALKEGASDPWARGAGIAGIPLGLGNQYCDKHTRLVWTLTYVKWNDDEMVTLTRVADDGTDESVSTHISLLGAFYTFVGCDHAAGCCRTHDVHSPIHNGCFLPIKAKGRLPLRVGDGYYLGSTGEMVVIAGLPGGGRVCLAYDRPLLTQEGDHEVTEAVLESDYEFDRAFDYCNHHASCCEHHGTHAEPHVECFLPPSESKDLPGVTTQTVTELPCDDHEERCCQIHRSHVRPHRDCSLKLL